MTRIDLNIKRVGEFYEVFTGRVEIYANGHDMISIHAFDNMVDHRPVRSLCLSTAPKMEATTVSL